MILLPVITLAVMTCFGYVFGWKRRIILVLGILLALAAVFLFCALAQKAGDGVDGLGYAIVAFLICLPGGAGLLGGTLLGWLVQRRRSG